MSPDDGAAERDSAPVLQALAAADTAALLLQALCEQYGEAAARAAEDRLHVAGDGSVDAQAVGRAVAAAAAARALFEGRSDMQRLARSARLSGAAFVTCCRRCGIDPATLALPRRQAIDEQFERLLAVQSPVDDDEADALLRRVLEQRLN